MIRKEETEGALSGALLSLSVLLRNQEIRKLFAQTGGATVLFSVLRTNMRNLVSMMPWTCVLDLFTSCE